MRHCITVFLLSTLLLAACTEVELCYSPDHPHTSTVQFMFDWEGQTELPDTMGVIAYRIVNHWKRMMDINSETQLGRYADTTNVRNLIVAEETEETSLAKSRADGEEESTTTDGENIQIGEEGEDDPTEGYEETPTEEVQDSSDPDSIYHNPFKIRTGEYKFIAFSLDTTEVSLNEVAEFLLADGQGKKLNDVNVEYKQYSKSDERLKSKVPGWLDYNQYALYIQPNVLPLYYDTVAIVKITEGEQATCTFRPKPITQNVDIYFNVTKILDPQPFVIDSIWAELAGVPRMISLSTGNLDISHTNKMMFPMELTTSDGAKIDDNEGNTQLRCHANIDVTGIVNAKSEDEKSGPGILQVFIYAHVGEGDGKKTKKVQGEINLFNTIDEAQPILYNEDDQTARRNGEHVVLDINANLQLDGEAIVKSPDNNGGLDRWIEVTEEGGLIIEL